MQRGKPAGIVAGSALRTIVMALDEEGIELTASVPFERFVELKGKIERWRRREGHAAARYVAVEDHATRSSAARPAGSLHEIIHCGFPCTTIAC